MTPTATALSEAERATAAGDAILIVWGVTIALAALVGFVVALRHLVHEMSRDRCEELRLRLEHERATRRPHPDGDEKARVAVAEVAEEVEELRARVTFLESGSSTAEELKRLADAIISHLRRP